MNHGRSEACQIQQVGWREPQRVRVATGRDRGPEALVFKRLKSLLHLDRLPTRTEAGSRSWLYAHLIMLLLTQDICQDFLESSP